MRTERNGVDMDSKVSLSSVSRLFAFSSPLFGSSLETDPVRCHNSRYHVFLLCDRRNSLALCEAEAERSEVNLFPQGLGRGGHRLGSRRVRSKWNPILDIILSNVSIAVEVRLLSTKRDSTGVERNLVSRLVSILPSPIVPELPYSSLSHLMNHSRVESRGRVVNRGRQGGSGMKGPRGSRLGFEMELPFLLLRSR